jgi:voltage-gated chloride channel
MLVKALLTSTSFVTGFDGGPIFPLLFIGGTLGLAICKILTFIPEGVAVTAGMAGVTSAVIPIPLTVTLLLGLLGGSARSCASDCHWGRYRLRDIQGAYAPASETPRTRLFCLH